jgi:hypothetical protein
MVEILSMRVAGRGLSLGYGVEVYFDELQFREEL